MTALIPYSGFPLSYAFKFHTLFSLELRNAS